MLSATAQKCCQGARWGLSRQWWWPAIRTPAEKQRTSPWSWSPGCSGCYEDCKNQKIWIKRLSRNRKSTDTYKDAIYGAKAKACTLDKGSATSVGWFRSKQAHAPDHASKAFFHPQCQACNFNCAHVPASRNTAPGKVICQKPFL